MGETCLPRKNCRPHSKEKKLVLGGMLKRPPSPSDKYRPVRLLQNRTVYFSSTLQHVSIFLEALVKVAY